MSAFGTTQPDSDVALQRLIVEARAERPRGMLERERLAGVATGVAFLIAAVLLATLVESNRSLELGLAVVLTATYALASRIEFHMGAVWTDPTQLVFVPMLFLLPTPLTPLFVAAALLLARLPDYRSGDVHPTRVVLRVADAWPAIGPALVLSLAGATTPELADLPIYLLAFAAQFGCDLGSHTIRETGAIGIPARAILRDARAVYLVDGLLAPVGLLAAYASTQQQWAFLLVLPLLGLIAIFAREREARIENALTLSSAYRGTAHLLGELLANSHEYTGSHSRSVVVLAHQVGEALGLDEEALREIEFGALLHDVGKMAIPVEILNKPAKLTDEEMELMRTHTVAGAQMLERIGGVLGEAGEVVRSHHEHYDGRGYPDGLAGAEIPIASRVIACCDAFNAMTTDRPYRAAMTIDAAVAEVRANSGTQFDPIVVEAVVGIVNAWETDAEAGRTGDPGDAEAMLVA